VTELGRHLPNVVLQPLRTVADVDNVLEQAWKRRLLS